MKTETCKLYSRVLWTYRPNFIKTVPYNFELYRFKVGAFFLRHSVDSVYAMHTVFHVLVLATAAAAAAAVDTRL